MYHNSDKIIILYIYICTLQLQPYLLTMASKPSTNTTLSTAAEQDPMPSKQSTAHGKKESGVTITSSIPNPAPTSVVQRYVTDAAEIISASPAYRRMFITEVFRKCNEIAQWEKDTGKTSSELPRSPPPSRRLPNYVFYQNYSDGKFIPAEQTQVLDRLVNNYSIPKTSSTTSGSTSTMTDSLATGKSSTTTTTAEPTEEAFVSETSTSQGDSRRKTASSYGDPGYNKSASVLKKRIEEGQSNQALTLFAPLGMAEDLTKIQFTLCNEIKAELQAVKESVAAIPFSDLKKKIVETTTSLEERMCGLEDKYNELKEIIIHRTIHPFNLDPSLLEKWDSTTMVLKHSPWTTCG